jgi:hypothetical protein
MRAALESNPTLTLLKAYSRDWVLPLFADHLEQADGSVSAEWFHERVAEARERLPEWSGEVTPAEHCRGDARPRRRRGPQDGAGVPRPHVNRAHRRHLHQISGIAAGGRQSCRSPGHGDIGIPLLTLGCQPSEQGVSAAIPSSARSAPQKVAPLGGFLQAASKRGKDSGWLIAVAQAGIRTVGISHVAIKRPHADSLHNRRGGRAVGPRRRCGQPRAPPQRKAWTRSLGVRSS